MRSIDEIRSSVRAPEVLNASRGIFRILPSRWDGIQNPLKYYLWCFPSTSERGSDSVQASELLRPFPQRPQLFVRFFRTIKFHLVHVSSPSGQYSRVRAQALNDLALDSLLCLSSPATC